MWFKKLSLKAAAVVLAGFASSAFSQALAPLQITADDWNYLSNFKLFGQTGLSFGNQDEFPNEAGWVGTATGDLYSTGNNGKVGGAVIVGGTIHPHSNMQFTTGPIRYGTGFTSGVYNGSVRCDGLTTSGSCKDVPLYRTNLKVQLMNVYEFTELVHTVPETDSVGTPFKKALEVDNVEGAGTKLSFFILDGNNEVSETKEFKLDSVTGFFSVATPLDFETTESYSIRVRAKDAEGVGDTTITIKVIDVNEVPSVLVDTIYVRL